MISKRQAINIVKDFLNTELEKEGWFVNVKPFVKAFVLYGSVAKGTNKPDSDIDVLLILPLEKEKEFTKGEYFYDYKGFKINIVLRSIEKLRKIAEQEKDLFQKEIFRKSEILMDIDGEVGDLLKEIEAQKIKLNADLEENRKQDEAHRLRIKESIIIDLMMKLSMDSITAEKLVDAINQNLIKYLKIEY